MPHTYEKDQKYRIIRDDCSLLGWKPVVGGQQGWSRKLIVGDILTCAGTTWTCGDGVPVVKWLSANGEHIAIDCEFRPSTGGMWSQRPDDSYLELLQ